MALTPADIDDFFEYLYDDGHGNAAGMKLAVACVALVDKTRYYGGSCYDCLMGQVATAIKVKYGVNSTIYRVSQWSGADRASVGAIFYEVAVPHYCNAYEAALDFACRVLGVEVGAARVIADELQMIKEGGKRDRDPE